MASSCPTTQLSQYLLAIIDDLSFTVHQILLTSDNSISNTNRLKRSADYIFQLLSLLEQNHIDCVPPSLLEIIFEFHRLLSIRNISSVPKFSYLEDPKHLIEVIQHLRKKLRKPKTSSSLINYFSYPFATQAQYHSQNFTAINQIFLTYFGIIDSVLFANSSTKSTYFLTWQTLRQYFQKLPYSFKYINDILLDLQFPRTEIRHPQLL